MVCMAADCLSSCKTNTSSAPNKPSRSVPQSWRPVYQRDSVACRSFHSSTKRMPPSEPPIQADEHTSGSSQRNFNYRVYSVGALSLSLLDSGHRFPDIGSRRTMPLHHRGESAHLAISWVI
ncbi:hypothetical protein V8C34DRAFT_128402 [Trichoderma compactum]